MTPKTIPSTAPKVVPFMCQKTDSFETRGSACIIIIMLIFDALNIVAFVRSRCSAQAFPKSKPQRKSSEDVNVPCRKRENAKTSSDTHEPRTKAGFPHSAEDDFRLSSHSSTSTLRYYITGAHKF